ncbi:MAG TPA: hypothetical protein VK841_14010 [Polyangiaceae bacterium]|jgi:hypothetical protein|nr:hypothetical protein [Polyangiaceae bacterium]
MKIAHTLAFAFLLVQCGEPKYPTLCVSTSGTDVTSLTACPQTTSQPFSVTSGQAVYVVSRLPDGVDPGDQTVSITLSTACGSATQSLSYSNDVAFGVFAAPPGSECSVTVTSTIENSTIRLVSAVDPNACGSGPVCPPDSGAGTEPADGGEAPTDAAGSSDAGDGS